MLNRVVHRPIRRRTLGFANRFRKLVLQTGFETPDVAEGRRPTGNAKYGFFNRKGRFNDQVATEFVEFLVVDRHLSRRGAGTP
jgi:hypothetical protein